MTKVTLHYDLTHALNDEDLASLENLHSTYGIARVQLAPSLDKITVDFDASRLRKSDVDAALARHFIPVSAPAA